MSITALEACPHCAIHGPSVPGDVFALSCLLYGTKVRIVSSVHRSFFRQRVGALQHLASRCTGMSPLMSALWRAAGAFHVKHAVSGTCEID